MSAEWASPEQPTSAVTMANSLKTFTRITNSISQYKKCRIAKEQQFRDFVNKHTYRLTLLLVPSLNAFAFGICGCAINSINFKPTVQTITSQLVYRFNSGS